MKPTLAAVSKVLGAAVLAIVMAGDALADDGDAALEGIAYQVVDVLDAMQSDSHIPLTELRVDGGASVNNLLMQFQADLLGVPVVRPMVAETTALGAARCHRGVLERAGARRRLRTAARSGDLAALFDLGHRLQRGNFRGRSRL